VIRKIFGEGNLFLTRRGERTNVKEMREEKVFLLEVIFLL
jgi:hypothetical protein